MVIPGKEMKNVTSNEDDINILLGECESVLSASLFNST